jgi:phosphatidylglycerophosphate synthase
MTSYIKAIGESHGVKFRMGALRRQERVTLICVGLVFTFLNQGMVNILRDIAGFLRISLGDIPIMPLTLIIYFLAIFTNFSAIQRFIMLRKITISGNEQPKNKDDVAKS